jgi:hypothetical protein
VFRIYPDRLPAAFIFRRRIMALDFKVKDIMHNVTAKFVHAFLPNAKKSYNLRAVFQPELDIHDIASKVEVYNIETDPKVIKDGFIAEVLDEHTGFVNEVMIIGNLLVISGYGLKIESDAEHEPVVGLWFDGPDAVTRAEIIPVNEPRTLKLIVPASPTEGQIRPGHRYPKLGERQWNFAEKPPDGMVQLQADRLGLAQGPAISE